MTRQFQFSLRRTLVAVGLLCVALVIGRCTANVRYGSDDVAPLLCATGVALAASVGVIGHRGISMAVGALIGQGVMLSYIYIDWIWGR
ncbi:MAG TPA: hypothetical protein VHC22_14780 [Pirellulales bacterium]|nr:hypothetical protein [Pirellulales bacterium]